MGIRIAAAMLVVTKGELKEIRELEAEKSELAHAMSEVEKKLKPKVLGLAEKVLGVTSADEFKTLSPTEVETRLIRRLEQKKWRCGPGAGFFQFVKTSEGRYPKWKDLFIKATSASRAEQEAADAPKIYSYRIEVS